MKKFLFSIVLLCFTVCSLSAANITVTMNGTSQTMTLKKKGTDGAVSVGQPESYKYSFSTESGMYVLSAFDSEGNLNGTIELDVTDAAEQAFSITTINVVSGNEGWVYNTDYTLECTAGSKATDDGPGASRSITLGETAIKGADDAVVKIPSFLIMYGDTYVARFIPTAARLEEGYLFAYARATMTSGQGTASAKCAIGHDFTFTVPKDASVFVGMKITHFVPFLEMVPKDVKAEGDKKIYTYSLNNGGYNYRVNQTGKLTRAGKLQVAQGTCDAIEITAEQMNADGVVPTYINHDVTANSNLNYADVFLNINKKGLLRLSEGRSFQIVNMRTWQLTDNSTNNYFFEPDYHYTVLNENFQPSNDVIQIDEKGKITAVGKGKAIVQVTYDALYCWQYTKSDGSGSAAMGGALWSAIWPENTGTFVVAVDQQEDEVMKPNFHIIKDMEETIEEIDTEHDIMYYLENKPGYYYSFKPEGATKVEVANPDVTTNPNIATYTGFSNTNVTKAEDGTYTVLLTFGRNIIRVTSEAGNTTYQVVSAKPVSYTITNETRPEDTHFYPGDNIKVQFKGYFHPAGKLAGIYNQSAYIFYNGYANGSSLILGSGQYTFAGDPKAQAFSFKLPASWEDEYYNLNNGTLQFKGFGSKPGAHRGITLDVGANPNFTAPVITNYWGSIPDVAIPISELTDGVKIEGLPENIEVTVLNSEGETINIKKDGNYYGTPGTYTYAAFANNRKAALGEFTITSGQGIKVIQASMEEIAVTDNTWDGKNVSLPEMVTAEESAVEGGEYAGMEGYYKIKNGYELAWLAYYVNKDANNAGTKAVLTRDIDLKKLAWTPIGTKSAKFNGTFEGNRHKIEGLYIDSETDYMGLFGYSNGKSTSNYLILRNLSVYGSVKTTGSYAAGVISYVNNGYCIIENCHNYADVTGKSCVGGVIGEAYYYPKEGNPLWEINNCSNHGNITGTSTIGGIAGKFNLYNYYILSGATFTGLLNTGTITSTKESDYAYMGGIAGGLIATNLKDVYNTGNLVAVAACTEIGGIAGYISSQKEQTFLLTNAYNAGDVSNKNSIVGSAEKDASITIKNTFTIAGTYQEGDTIPQKSADTFANGEIAWLLGDNYGQEIGKDATPVFSETKVYQVKYTSNHSNEVNAIYTNGTLPATLNGSSVVWKTVKGGNKIESVSADAVLYAEFDGGTGLKDVTNIQAVYPTPFRDNLHVVATENVTMYMYDNMGRLVLTQQLVNGDNIVDGSALSAGMYMIRCGETIYKVIKQ